VSAARVYIAGPMRGYAEHNYPAFRCAARNLRELGFDVISPVEVNHGPDDTGEQPPEHYLRNDLIELVRHCDSIALLDGWEESIGARCEAAIAITLGLTFRSSYTGDPVARPAHIVIDCGYRPTSQGDTGSAMRAVLAELDRAMRKFPTWPTDPLHALAVLGEEYGELQRAVLQHTYEPEKATQTEVRAEATQTAAMALRLLLSLDRYVYAHSMQHRQVPDDAAETEVTVEFSASGAPV